MRVLAAILRYHFPDEPEELDDNDYLKQKRYSAFVILIVQFVNDGYSFLEGRKNPTEGDIPEVKQELWEIDVEYSGFHNRHNDFKL